jgi:hypothetical protein
LWHFCLSLHLHYTLHSVLWAVHQRSYLLINLRVLTALRVLGGSHFLFKYNLLVQYSLNKTVVVSKYQVFLSRFTPLFSLIMFWLFGK